MRRNSRQRGSYQCRGAGASRRGRTTNNTFLQGLRRRTSTRRGQKRTSWRGSSASRGWRHSPARRGSRTRRASCAARRWQRVDIALLWQYMGGDFTAKQIFDFYKALPLYSIKRSRTSKEKSSKRQRRSNLEKESYAALNMLTLEAAKTICWRWLRARRSFIPLGRWRE